MRRRRVDSRLVSRLARLQGLPLTAGELAPVAAELNNLLEAAEALDELDLDDTLPELLIQR